MDLETGYLMISAAVAEEAEEAADEKASPACSSSLTGPGSAAGPPRSYMCARAMLLPIASSHLRPWTDARAAEDSRRPSTSTDPDCCCQANARRAVLSLILPLSLIHI